jgi:hypothetical protein
VTVITYIASDTQTQGLLAVPCVVGQLVQIFVGQPLAHYLADRIARWRRRNPQAAAAPAEPPPPAAAAPEGPPADGAVLVDGRVGDVENGGGAAGADKAAR